MVDVFTDGTALANLLAAGYDRELEYQLRSRILWRQFVDKHPVDVTNPGPTVTLSLFQEFAALATTPLTEDVDVAAVAPPAPVRVTVTLNEYGNVEITSLKVKTLAFTQVDPAVANVLGKNQIDTIDKLVQSTFDGATNVMGFNGSAVPKSQNSGFAEASVAATDVINSTLARDAVAVLRRRNAIGVDDFDQYVAVIHPDVAVDIMSDTGWLNPHQYQDTSNIYHAEIGTYLGARYVSTPRCTIVADGAAAAKVYRTTYLGQQAVVEAMAIEPHIVIGPQVDRLRRSFPIGWYGLGGWSIFRQEAIQQVRTSASIAAL
jgi:N4-gp56 family major capsid protein